MSKNTVLGYKKGSKPQIIFQILKICTVIFPTHFQTCSYVIQNRKSNDLKNMHLGSLRPPPKKKLSYGVRRDIETLEMCSRWIRGRLLTFSVPHAHIGRIREKTVFLNLLLMQALVGGSEHIRKQLRCYPSHLRQ